MDVVVGVAIQDLGRPILVFGVLRPDPQQQAAPVEPGGIEFKPEISP